MITITTNKVITVTIIAQIINIIMIIIRNINLI